MKVEKRDGTLENFERAKIELAIEQAYLKEYPEVDNRAIGRLVDQVIALCPEIISVEEIQDIVVAKLMEEFPPVAVRYIKYRERRRELRLNKTALEMNMAGIINVDSGDLGTENANMSSQTPAGQMMKIASLNAKDYALNYLISKEYGQMHLDGDIHIHDLDYYPCKTTTCLQYDLRELYEGGFMTKNGYIKEPQSIETYCTLATIVFQTNQNEQHGGQSIPAFDFFLAPGVLKSFKKNLTKISELALELQGKTISNLKNLIESCVVSMENIDKVKLGKEFSAANLNLEQILELGEKQTERDTYQGMEGFIHNLNTMHSRGGNQVVFSSINYGTDTSKEGRMVIENILKATSAGLGNGEVPVFPIQIFKVKEGINYSEEDLQLAHQQITWDEDFLRSNFKERNFDLFLRSILTTSTSLFPNYVFLDASFNQHELWRADDPLRYKYEVATMGCRTRVFENVQGESTSLGRGNLSFTTINLVRLAIKAAEGSTDLGERKKIFKRELKEIFHKVEAQLLERMKYQKSAQVGQFPFMLGNNIWKRDESLQESDFLGSNLDSGTLAIGFIGGHNAMVAIFGAGHGELPEANDFLLETVRELRDLAEELKAIHHLNFSILATPAEGLSGRFTRLDREKFGLIKGVNDLDYYVNSFHVDVKSEISAYEKIKLEAPYHDLTRGGHITYLEVDGEAKKNPVALLKIIETMKDSNIGYGSINHPVDKCSACHYSGLIGESCPICQSKDIRRMRRITGYLTGDLASWNSAKRAEEKDRVKHL